MAYPSGFGGGLGAAMINQRKPQANNPFAGWTKATSGTGSPVGMDWIRGQFGLGGMMPQMQPRGNPYAGLMDEYLNQMRSDLGAQSVADAASRDAAMRKLIISYGDVSGFENQGGLSGAARGFLQGALDPKTLDLAKRNTEEGTSIKARMDESNMLQQRRIPSQLASRGLLRSGQTGADLGQQAMDFKRQGFDVLNELLGNIEGATSSFTNAEMQRQRALADAAMQARMMAMQDWGGMVSGYPYQYPPQQGPAPQQSVAAQYKSSRPGSHTWNPFVQNWRGGGL